jgi:hypothetical protein
MRELKWQESLAPKPPPVDADQRGNLQLLERIQENTEYPFWSAAKESLVAPAHGNHALGPRRSCVQNSADLSDGTEQVKPAGVL